VVPIWILPVHLHSSIGKFLTKRHIYVGITILLVYNCVPLWPIVKVAWDLAFSMGNVHWIVDSNTCKSISKLEFKEFALLLYVNETK
jgi:hypothetical protein